MGGGQPRETVEDGGGLVRRRRIYGFCSRRVKGFTLSVQGGKGFTLSVREYVKEKQYTLILFFNFHLYGFRQRFLKALANMDL